MSLTKLAYALANGYDYEYGEPDLDNFNEFVSSYNAFLDKVYEDDSCVELVSYFNNVRKGLEDGDGITYAANEMYDRIKMNSDMKFAKDVVYSVLEYIEKNINSEELPNFVEHIQAYTLKDGFADYPMMYKNFESYINLHYLKDKNYEMKDFVELLPGDDHVIDIFSGDTMEEIRYVAPIVLEAEEGVTNKVLLAFLNENFELLNIYDYNANEDNSEHFFWKILDGVYYYNKFYELDYDIYNIAGAEESS